MRELLKRVLMARTIGYPLPPSLVKDIEAELAKDMPEPDYRRVLKEINEFIIDQPEGTDSLCAHTVQQKPLSWDASGKEYDRSIHSNPDATAWADLFLETFPNCGADRGTMVGWFANAIMAMYDWKDRQQKPLSDEKIKLLADEIFNYESGIDDDAFIFARAIEQAHGIK